MSHDKPRQPFIDLEAVRRRRALEAEQRRYPGLAPRPEEPGSGEEEMRFGWKDVLAMTIAAYQILLPVVGVIIAALVGVYLIFRLLFH